MASLIIINQPKKWNFSIPGIETISPRDYLTNKKYFDNKDIKIYNLSKSYKYQSEGYYVSLLAMARGHMVMPGISTLQDMKSQAVIRVIEHDLDELIQKSLKKETSKKYTLSIYFGKNLAKKNDKLSNQLFNMFRAPLLRAFFIYDSRDKKWHIQNITTIPASEIPEDHKPYVEEFARLYFTSRNFSSNQTKISKKAFTLAILTNPIDIHSPSDEKAIQKFVSAADKKGFDVHLITKDDYAKIPQYDALFIRETTSVNHHTYRFSQRAKAEGLIVIDDPESIIKCTNKVYLAELLNSHSIPSPKTIVLHKENLDEVSLSIAYPIILKQPDGAFSLGVLKVSDPTEFLYKAKAMLEFSDLIIAQEFTPTEFDWRVGVIDRKPLYVSKYYMAKNHWQIYDHNSKAEINYGDSESIRIEDAPTDLIKTAIKGCNLIGDGFYGVDLKQVGKEFYIIEINDNPSIDSDTEDQILKDELYERIIDVFWNRIKEKKK
ncbi:MAG: RimK family protein [Leptospira sp.]|nr:RimK family protein [Leptospira sp.]NCS92434.1 RimK family protein [Leptospira sp.]